MDMQGGLVFKEAFIATTSHIIEAESFARGVYSMRITYSNGAKKVKKVILH